MNRNGAIISTQDDLFFTYAENFNQRKLTIEQLQKFNGFEKISDTVALEIIDELCKLTIITYKIYNKKNGTRTV